MDINVLLYRRKETDDLGNIDFFGTFDAISPDAYPCEFPTFFLFVQVALDARESSTERSFTIRMVRPDGMMTAEASRFDVPPSSFPSGHRPVHVFLGYRSIRFPEPGTYRFEIEHRERVVKDTPLLLHPAA